MEEIKLTEQMLTSLEKMAQEEIQAINTVRQRFDSLRSTLFDGYLNAVPGAKQKTWAYDAEKGVLMERAPNGEEAPTKPAKRAKRRATPKAKAAVDNGLEAK